MDPLALDDNATMGVLPGIDVAERQAQLQERLDEGMIAFSINTSPVFATGGSEGNLMLENPANNAKLLVVEIYIDATQELVYQSKAIPTGFRTCIHNLNSPSGWVFSRHTALNFLEINPIISAKICLACCKNPSTIRRFRL